MSMRWLFCVADDFFFSLTLVLACSIIEPIIMRWCLSFKFLSTFLHTWVGRTMSTGAARSMFLLSSLKKAVVAEVRGLSRAVGAVMVGHWSSTRLNTMSCACCNTSVTERSVYVRNVGLDRELEVDVEDGLWGTTEVNGVVVKLFFGMVKASVEGKKKMYLQNKYTSRMITKVESCHCAAQVLADQVCV